ncbi:hypothetical protein [Streptomyces cinnamoneus]|uniref:Uncharacterized protein n=1 Tax=Streptomyces cinnamoneus TaxID=53446 RepID=A0A918TF25_STRCJ|nr:hypothetical protein [Streptomyces cinnamoneus]GHC43341.1 hypothetical protein GCM10010507_17790 [Streptomyces cinnamoneus]
MTGPGGSAGGTAWSGTVRERADRLRDQADRLRAGAGAVTLPGAEGTALRQRILTHAVRAETAALALERAAEALHGHEAVLAALARRRRAKGGAPHIG